MIRVFCNNGFPRGSVCCYEYGVIVVHRLDGIFLENVKWMFESAFEAHF
ncbi:hypothetical protein PBCV1_a240dL [Paramecium bursaria Chlorella virus 1]|uniref:Uncharacterized protein n=1 Tax=Paramecium bursaria Chlorella virus 1 TaxID=10506 RepID=F8TU04_PBCV1|nr:hypothetical protein PBCV1_a240dL [Paramecium bursaria Chlorella virus 1]AEI70065.1 hypothetical protein [Paramecium bursaria Chlorella virus 1]